MNDIIMKLGARPLSSDSGAISSTIELKRRLGIELPAEFMAILKKIGDAVVFDNGAKVAPLELTGREDARGYRQVEIFYGLRDDVNGVVTRNEMLGRQLPPDLISIGGLPGGDQVCLAKGKGGGVYSWKHDVGSDEASSMIATDIEHFLEALEPDDIEDDSGDGPDVASSFFDF